jgi:hypothetical protein
MGNELIGKIFFSVDNEDWISDNSEPVLHGVHLLDCIGTNRWPGIMKSRKNLDESKNANLLTLLGLLNKNKEELEDVSIFYNSCFDPYELYLIDILMFISYTGGIVSEEIMNSMSSAWTNPDSTRNREIIFQDVILKLNKTIDVLSTQKIRIGHLGVEPMKMYPDQEEYKEYFPRIGQLKFVSYSPRK